MLIGLGNSICKISPLSKKINKVKVISSTIDPMMSLVDLLKSSAYHKYHDILNIEQHFSLLAIIFFVLTFPLTAHIRFKF